MTITLVVRRGAHRRRRSDPWHRWLFGARHVPVGTLQTQSPWEGGEGAARMPPPAQRAMDVRDLRREGWGPFLSGLPLGGLGGGGWRAWAGTSGGGGGDSVRGKIGIYKFWHDKIWATS